MFGSFSGLFLPIRRRAPLSLLPSAFPARERGEKSKVEERERKCKSLDITEAVSLVFHAIQHSKHFVVYVIEPLEQNGIDMFAVKGELEPCLGCFLRGIRELVYEYRLIFPLSPGFSEVGTDRS